MIKIWCDLFSFESEEHVILWSGKDNLALNSGTHKSHLFAIMEAKLLDKQMFASKNLILLNDVTNAHNLKFSDEDCLILDEANYSPSKLDIIFRKIRDANAYMIVIGRLFIKQLEYSVGAIYEFEYNAQHIEFRAVFSQTHKGCSRHDLIVCEDSTQVASVYAETLREDVRPVYGRSNFYSNIKRSGEPLLIADYPKFGADLVKLLYKIFSDAVRTRMNDITLFCPDCFEKIVCEVAALNNVELPNLNTEDYFDAEYYYEALAENIPLWNKSKVAASVIDMQKVWDFSKAKTLQELYSFVYKGDEDISTHCYRINLSDFMRRYQTLLTDTDFTTL